MTEQEIIELINKVFEDDFEIEKVNLRPQAHIFNDLGLDSLDIIDLVVALQQNFKIKLKDEEKIREIRTLQDVYNFILNEKNKPAKG